MSHLGIGQHLPIALAKPFLSAVTSMKITSPWPVASRRTTPRIKSLLVRFSHLGYLFYGDRSRIRRIPKAKTWPDLFRKLWLHAPGPLTAAHKAGNFS